jgi:hypothetical protein
MTLTLVMIRRSLNEVNMAYSIATHGEKYRARTVQTTCGYCGRRVFYFKCDRSCHSDHCKMKPALSVILHRAPDLSQ